MSFMVFAGGFYLTACMYVEAKKFRWSWPSPYAHAQRDPDKKEGSKALPHELAELNRQLAAQHQARTRRADRPDGGGPATGLPPEGSLARELFHERAGQDTRATPRYPRPAGYAVPNTSSRVDQSRVIPGSVFSFCYPHGERKGQRRTVRLIKWMAEDLFQVHDENVNETRYYHAFDTYGVEYLYGVVTPGEPPEPRREPAPSQRPAARSRRSADESRSSHPGGRSSASGSGGATTVSIIAPDDFARGGSPQEGPSTLQDARLVWQESRSSSSVRSADGSQSTGKRCPWPSGRVWRSRK